MDSSGYNGVVEKLNSVKNELENVKTQLNDSILDVDGGLDWSSKQQKISDLISHIDTALSDAAKDYSNCETYAGNIDKLKEKGGN